MPSSSASRHVIAVDLGAESGRVIQVNFDGSTLTHDEVHRFPNVAVQVGDILHWDALRLWHDITTGIKQAAPDAAGIGVDTWGVDFALLDRAGRLIMNPIHYRDPSILGMLDWVTERVPKRAIFERTGIQFMEINTLYRFASLLRYQFPALDIANTLLTIPSLFTYWLSGSMTCEFTHASTSQMFDPRRANWDTDTLNAVGLPINILPEVVQPGTKLGEYEGIPVFASASHDTASAVVAVPTTTRNYAYLSSGTWSLIGLEVDEPVITDKAYEYNLTNEGGYNNTYRLLKNVMGLWLAQQCRATWAEEGQEYSYGDLVRLAEGAEPFFAFVDPDTPEMLAPGDMPSRIREYCQRTDQKVPETPGQIMRVIYESLAMKYRYSLDALIAVSGREVDRLHIIGGGSRNTLLAQMTADAIGRMVITGPVEGTALGNAIVQLITTGDIGDLNEARALLSQTVETATYEPEDVSVWETEYERFKALPLVM